MCDVGGMQLRSGEGELSCWKCLEIAMWVACSTDSGQLEVNCPAGNVLGLPCGWHAALTQVR